MRLDDEELSGTPKRHTPFDVLKTYHGFTKLVRFATKDAVYIIGLRQRIDARGRSENQYWTITVDKRCHEARVSRDHDVLMDISCENAGILERTAIRGLIVFLCEKRRTSHSQRRTRKQLRSVVTGYEPTSEELENAR